VYKLFKKFIGLTCLLSWLTLGLSLFFFYEPVISLLQDFFTRIIYIKIIFIPAGILSGVLIITALLIYLVCSLGGSDTADLIRFENEYGMLNISISGMESYFIRLFENNELIRKARCKIIKRGNKFYIFLRFSLASEQNIREFSAEIQRTVREKTEKIFGIEQIPVVEVYYTSVN